MSEVLHSCQDTIKVYEGCPMFNPQGLQDALDTMRENTETKQGSTVDVESASSQETRQSTYVSSCRRLRSRESSAAYSEAMMSH